MFEEDHTHLQYYRLNRKGYLKEKKELVTSHALNVEEKDILQEGVPILQIRKSI